MTLFIILVVSTYVLMHAIEISSFGARVAGRISNRRALGTTLAQTIYTASRFLLVILLPSLGFIVESGITLGHYLLIAILSFALTFLASLYIIFKLNFLQKFFQVLFLEYKNNSIPIAALRTLKSGKRINTIESCDKFKLDKIIFKKTVVSSIAYIFLTTGFFIAFLLAVLYPDNRLTLSQFTAFFHGFGSIIFAFYLDPMLSRSIDSYDDESIWLKNVYSILIGRSVSYFLMTALFGIIFLFQAIK